eukprot:scaffold2388_cov163-Amphora_coffeaeformis.AAC.12
MSQPQQLSHERISASENPFLSLSSSSSLSFAPGETRVGVLAEAFRGCLVTTETSENNPSDEEYDDINLDRLLEACRRFKENMHAVGQHGNARDLGNNLLKVEQSLRQAPPEIRTVRGLLEYEKQLGVRLLDDRPLKNPSAAMGLLWMRRAVAFQLAFNQFLEEPEVPTVDVALQAYSQELEPFHSWALQQVFKLAFRTMTPGRSKSLAELWGKSVEKLELAEEAIVIQQLKILGDIWPPKQKRRSQKAAPRNIPMFRLSRGYSH